MAWIFNDGAGSTLELVVTTTAAAVYRFKELLKTAGWVHEASSDGTNVSNTSGNANDQISSSSEMATNNAWFVLSQPAISRGLGYPGNRQIIVRRGTSDLNWLWVYVPANSDGTKQAKTANGTTTAIPTFATSAPMLGTMPDTAVGWTSGTISQRTFQIGADNAAPYGWYLLATRNSSGTANPVSGYCAWMDFMVPGTYDALDKDPCVVFALVDTSPLDARGTKSITSVSAANVATSGCGPQAYCRYGMTGQVFSQVGMIMPCISNNGTPKELLPGGISKSPFSGKWPRFPLMYGTGGVISGVPLSGSGGVATGQPAYIKGESYMFRWRPGGLPTGHLLKHRYAGDRCVIADLVVPWDGASGVAGTIINYA